MNELQVIILAAGKGSRLREMTTNRPKCLLPIGLYPMVYYPMKMFERFGFKELYLIVSEMDKNEVETALEQTDLAIKFNSITVPCDAEDRGTAYSLRFIAPYITSDFIVVSCDLISDIDINSILNFHRKNDASLTVLYFHAPSAVTDLIVPGSKTGNKTERDLVGIDPATNRLVFSASASDYVKNLRMKRGLLYKHGRVRMHTSLLDAHFYVMKRWLIRYLVNNERFATVKGELLPYAVQQQISSKNKLRSSRNEPSRADISLEVSPVKVDREKDSDIFSMAENFGCDTTAQTMSSFNDHSGDLSKVYLKDNIRCYAYIVPDEFGLRCNSMREFCRANKLMIEKWKDFANSETSNISSESKVESNQVESCSCFVGAKTTIESKTSISKTTLGSGCHVQQKTKVIDCVIMNDVKIGEGCNLSNCIICDDVVISENCSLKDCFIGNRHSVPPNSSHKNEMIAEVENFMEVS